MGADGEPPVNGVRRGRRERDPPDRSHVVGRAEDLGEDGRDPGQGATMVD